MKLSIVSLLVAFLGPVFAQYVVPDALVEVFRPRGLRVSIPHEEGIKLFAFHGKINEEMNGREGGFFSRDILKPINGRWTFYDATAKLNVGDTLYYWTYVDYFDGTNKLGYTNDDQKFIVTELLEKGGGGTGCKESVTVINNAKVCENKLIFEENFDSLDTTTWTPEVKFAGGPDYEFVMYGKHPRNLGTQEGHLTIQPLPTEEIHGAGFVNRHHEVNLGDNCTGKVGTNDCTQSPQAVYILPPVQSAQISTKNKFSFKYGKVEIRAKLPKGDWIYPELYLNPRFEDYGPGYASGQIRVAFLAGNSDSLRNLQGGCILGSTRAARNYAIHVIRKNEGSWAEDFHTFTVVWKPDQITLSVDNQIYGNIYAPEGGFARDAPNLNKHSNRWRSGTNLAPFDKEMFLTIGVGAGGHNFEDRHDGSKPWVNTQPKAQKDFYRAQSVWRPTWGDDSVLKVDYVKVWAL